MMSKIYFASDFHLGLKGSEDSANREKRIVRWLEEASIDAEAIYILGDIFDFWFEYKAAVPKGFVRLLGKLAELRDNGIPIVVFTGNHDMWMFDYFEKELNIPIRRRPILIDLQGKKLLIGHGDGLGPGDFRYKLLKRIFANRLCQWLFERIHPNLGMGVANFWSRRSRAASKDEGQFLGKEKEWLIAYCERKLSEIPDIDYFVFGHRHLCIDHTLSNQKARYINLGEWLYNRSFAVMENGMVSIKSFENEKMQCIISNDRTGPLGSF